jgi:arylsulfatase A-like enzyme
VIPKGVVDDKHFICNGLDLLPTLCDYAGVRVPDGRCGMSLRALAEGRAKVKWRDFVVTESWHGRMVRTERFKYSVYESGKNREQLVDMKEDPGEMKNLAGKEEFKNVLKEHRKLLQKWVEKVGDKVGAEYIIAEGT